MIYKTVIEKVVTRKRHPQLGSEGFFTTNGKEK